MSWAKVRAINSDFSMPLNELLGKKFIVSENRLVSVLTERKTITVTGNPVSEYLGSFTPKISGELKIQGNCIGTGARIQIRDSKSTTTTNITFLTQTDAYKDFTIEKGKTYYIYITDGGVETSGTDTFDSIYICGNVVDDLIEYNSAI